MSETRAPRTLHFALGMVCEAGQHENCTPVDDPYEGDRSDPVWVCSCDCHPWTGDFMERVKIGMVWRRPSDPCWNFGLSRRLHP